MFEWNGGLNAFYSREFVKCALSIAARSCGVDPAQMATDRRRASVAFARQLAMYLCHVVGDMSLRDVSRAFDRDRTTVSHACHAIEDRRDHPVFDRQVEFLENELRREARALVERALAAPPIERKCLRLVG
jgi:hypothetical protein